MQQFDIRPLHERIKEIEEISDRETAEDVILKLLKTFVCNKNKDVEHFLHNLSLRYEKENKARTYLITNEDLEIVAYFSIALKPIIIDGTKHKVSGSLRKRLKPQNIVKNDEEHEIINTFLIGQIGRNDNFDKSVIGLEEILNEIFEKITNVTEIIGGHVILIEVDNNEKLINLYKSFGFQLLADGSEDDLTQLMKFSGR